MSFRGSPRARQAGVWVFLLTLCASSLAAGEEELSHAERFAPPKAKYERAEENATARLAKDPKDARALLARGWARLHLGQTEAAIGDLHRAVALDPSSAEAQAQLAYGLWVQGHWAEALTAAQEALRRDPDLASAHYYAGRLLLVTEGDPREAVRHLERAVELNPEQADLRFDLLTAYRAAGDTVRAALQLRILRAALPPNDARAVYAEGLLASDLGQLSAAIDRFRQAVAAGPKLTPARHDLGMALVKAERWQEALDVLGPLAQQSPRSFSTAYFYALALQNTQRLEESEREVRRALALEPDSASATTLLGIVLSKQAAYAEAGAILERAAQLDPKSFDAFLYLGRARYALRDLPAAREAFRRALELKPDEPEARFFLATVLEQAGERETALAQYHELIRRFPQDPRGYVGLGNFLARHGQADEASSALRHALELDPENFEATLALGRLLTQAGQLKAALPLLRRAAQRQPENAEAHYQLALALKRDGRPEDAKREFDAVDRLNREHRTAGSPGGNPLEPPP